MSFVFLLVYGKLVNQLVEVCDFLSKFGDFSADFVISFDGTKLIER